MILFNILMKCVAAGSLLTYSTIAVADQSDYKLMVIDQSITADVAENRQYEQAFNKSTLSVQLNNFTEAGTLCSKAIVMLLASCLKTILHGLSRI